MKKELNINEFVEKKLDQITVAGEWVGKYLGRFGRTTQKLIIGSFIVGVFGIAAFLWAVGKGMGKKK